MLERFPDMERIPALFSAMAEVSPFVGRALLTSDSGRSVGFPAVMPGPMEGVMRGCFCRAAVESGLVPGWMTPFIRISSAVPRRKVLSRYLDGFLAGGVPVIVQLMGTDPLLMAQTAELLADTGIAGIDVNFACPSTVVVRHGGGGGMLRTPALMADILRAVRPVCSGISLSAKLRTGFFEPGEMRGFIPRICECGVDFISVHFRTVKEGYSAVAGREERLEEAVALAGKIPVVGSGDVDTVRDANLIAAAGCRGIMAARGWLRDPWLLRRLYLPVDDMSPEPAAARMMLLEKMAELARLCPEQYWSRPAMLEAAVFMFGSQHPVFRRLIELTPDQWLNGELWQLAWLCPDDPADRRQE